MISNISKLRKICSKFHVYIFVRLTAKYTHLWRYYVFLYRPVFNRFYTLLICEKTFKTFIFEIVLWSLKHLTLEAGNQEGQKVY